MMFYIIYGLDKTIDGVEPYLKPNAFVS